MPAPDQFAAARARRIRAEADEIATYAPGRRPTGTTTRRTVHVYDAYPLADMAEICQTAPGEGRLPLAGLLVITLLMIIGPIMSWLVMSVIDWQAVLDFIAPTAAQARNAGWVAISEGVGNGL